MQASNVAAMTALRKELSWVKRQLTDRDPDPVRLANRAQDVTIGCLYILANSPTLDLVGRTNRKPGRRKAILGCRQSARDRKANKVLCDLIRLAISDLEASQSFRPTVEVGPLAVAEQTKRPQTQAQRDALARLHARRRAEKEDAENERQRRLGGEVGTYTAPTNVAEKITL